MDTLFDLRDVLGEEIIMNILFVSEMNEVLSVVENMLLSSGYIHSVLGFVYTDSWIKCFDFCVNW